jgi:hypothetical protein
MIRRPEGGRCRLPVPRPQFSDAVDRIAPAHRAGKKSYGHRKPVGEWEVLLKDHHDDYIDWAEFERYQRQLAVNAYYGKLGWVKSGAVVGRCWLGCYLVAAAGVAWW